MVHGEFVVGIDRLSMLVEERDQIGRIVVFITIIEVECGKMGNSLLIAETSVDLEKLLKGKNTGVAAQEMEDFDAEFSERYCRL